MVFAPLLAAVVPRAAASKLQVQVSAGGKVQAVDDADFVKMDLNGKGYLSKAEVAVSHKKGPSQNGGVKIKIFGPVFRGFSPEIDPGTPLDRPGAFRTSICTKDQPRRPILRPFRGVFLGFSPDGGLGTRRQSG